MHEMSIAENLLNILTEILREHPEYRIQKVFVEVGELVAVVPESLRFCYQALTEDTPLQDSELVIKVIPIRIRCQECRQEHTVENFLFRCPSCGSSSLKELSGREFAIKSLEVEE